MSRINSVEWARVRIDRKDYWQALIVGDKVIPREVEKVKKKYGTDHVVADWEQKMLLSSSPEVILIASSWSGVLKINEKIKNLPRSGIPLRGKISKMGIELRVVLTPKVVEEYNRLIVHGKRVNCLIHTTC